MVKLSTSSTSQGAVTLLLAPQLNHLVLYIPIATKNSGMLSTKEHNSEVAGSIVPGTKSKDPEGLVLRETQSTGLVGTGRSLLTVGTKA